MDWTPSEARAAERFAALDLNLEGTLTWTAGGSVTRYRLMFDDKPYVLPGGKAFATVPDLERAYMAQLPTFELHAACCHRLMLRYFDEPAIQPAIDEWMASDALPALANNTSVFPWTSAVQKARPNGGGYLHTFGPPWTGVDVELNEPPGWMGHDIAVECFDPARPRIYLAALKRLLDTGEQWWMAGRMPAANAAVIRRRL